MQFILFLSLMISISLNTARAGDAEIEETQEPTLTLDSKNNIKKEIVEKTETEKTKQQENNQASLKLASIDVTGVADDLKKNIELHMPVTIPGCDADRSDVKLFFNTVKKNLRKATRALGYYDAEFTSGGSLLLIIVGN